MPVNIKMPQKAPTSTEMTQTSIFCSYGTKFNLTILFYIYIIYLYSVSVWEVDIVKNILVVEDDRIQAVGLKKMISTYYTDASVLVAFDSDEAAKIYEEYLIDLFILDVNLSDSDNSTDGIDIGISLRKIKEYQTTPIIYITSYRDKIYRAVNDAHCYKFLEKPYTAEELFDTLREIDKLKHSSLYTLTVKDNRGGIHKIPLEDILVISSERHTIKVCSATRNFYTKDMTLKEYLDILPTNFIRIHKSYIVNLNYVNTYDKTTRTISVNGQLILTVGKSYMHNFDKMMES